MAQTTEDTTKIKMHSDGLGGFRAVTTRTVREGDEVVTSRIIHSQSYNPGDDPAKSNSNKLAEVPAIIAETAAIEHTSERIAARTKFLADREAAR